MEEEAAPSRRRSSRIRKQEETAAKETPSDVVLQQTSTTHITRSMTKTMAKEEKEALLDPEQIEKEIKESCSGKVKEFEFGGPVGVFLMMVALPVLIYALYFYCNGKNSKCSFRNNPIKLPYWRKFFDIGHLFYDGWLLFQVVLFFLPLGKVRMV